MWTFHWGTVGSGKSLDLLKNYFDKKRNHPNDVCLVKPGFDSRTTGIYTRFGETEIPADIVLTDTNRLEWLNLLKTKKYFFIDEVQFLDERTLDHIISANRQDNVFHTYGLRNDFKGEVWPISAKVFNHCDSIMEIVTECTICKERKASFNKNLKKDATENELGFHYTGVCIKCFHA